ncbi:nitroreductase family deazaflavin-dependent oxidoreductase [Kribbella sancticallisti]|uniref:Nitroreductase family deazaflavin-dependent oxidoreductase n=1 Tax=Kribbella sancticallisti TaxID=460087 RepID=A0ABP4QWT7_9ACTN
MSTDEDYAPSPTGWVRDAVAKIEAAGDTKAGQWNEQKLVLLTMRGAKSGKSRKVPLMRVEHDGRYVAVGSNSGATNHPVWYYNLLADPKITLQDGTESRPMIARELHGDERTEWWKRATAVFPTYLSYQQETDRLLPLFLLEPVQ